MKRLRLLAISLLSSFILSSCNGSLPISKKYNVTSNSNVLISNPTAIDNTKYETVLSVGNGYTLPETIDGVDVTIDSKSSTFFSYSRETPNYANFSIEAEYVVGPIDIRLSLEPAVYDVTVAEGVKLETQSHAIFHKKYENYLVVEKHEGFVLPEDSKYLIVKINNVPINKFSYERIAGQDNKASFSIEGEFVTGPIDIQFDFDYQKYDVGVTLGVDLDEGKDQATYKKEYSTTLIGQEGVVLPTDNNGVKVSIGGKTFNEFIYERDSEDTGKANFSIDAGHINGDLNIELEISDEVYSVTVPAETCVKSGDETATYNKKYTTTITSNYGYYLPASISKINISGSPISSSTYSYSRRSDQTIADLSINADVIKGPIEVVFATIKEQFDVEVTEGVSLESRTTKATYKTEYFTNLTADQGKSLPEHPSSVIIGGEEVDSTKYTYTINPSDEMVATFYVSAENVTGKININLELGDLYEAKIDGSVSDQYTLSNTRVNPNKNFVTKISLTNKDATKRVPETLAHVIVGGNYLTTDDYSYIPNQLSNYQEGTLTINSSHLTGDVDIILSPVQTKYHWYEFNDWWNYCSNGSNLQAVTNDIGEIVYFNIDGYYHKVRLVGIDHDELSNGNGMAHCTFDLINTIANKYSVNITSAWNNDEDNKNFVNSTLNKYLQTTVLSFLDKNLKNAIKTVNKKVGVYNGTEYAATTYSTKLFPLAYDEILKEKKDNVTKGEGTLYEYYRREDADIVKRGARDGGEKFYWTRSPNTTRPSSAWLIREDKGAKDMYPTSNRVPIAFAFCI